MEKLIYLKLRLKFPYQSSNYSPLIKYADLACLLQSIGRSYEDMQTQNQHLLQQIIERDDYNIKVINNLCLLLLFILIVTFTSLVLLPACW